MKKRALLICLAMVLVAALSVGLTLAYLQDYDTATNTFTVGDVDISLDEADVNEYGVAIANASRVTANEYKLIPGHEYVKDPTVTVEGGSEPSYVRMLVTVTDYSDLKTAAGALGTDYVSGEIVLLEKFVTGWDSATWLSKGVTVSADGSTAEYVFWYKDTVSALEKDSDTDAYKDVPLDALFDGIVIPGTMDVSALSGLTINVVAHAIQADGFDTADAAWEAWTAE